MGEVYRARDSSLKRDVAIKVLPSGWSSDPERLHRFEFEAQAAAALNHPNIVSIFHVGRCDGSPYIVTELLQGETLRERLRRGRIPLREALDIGISIARGLAAASAAGIVHRDLKPENIFLTKDGRVKILDFGVAKLDPSRTTSAEDETLTHQQTSPGSVVGTAGYMSPEQIRGEAADTRSDIFALGLILYEMLAGQRAFHKPTSADTMSAILNEEPPPISHYSATIPPALQHVVQRCLEKEPEKRFQNASDLGFALEALSDPSGASVPATTQKGSASTWLWSTVALVVLFAAALCFLGWALWLRRTAHQFAALPMRLELRLPSVDFFAVSPNGEQIAFTAPGADGRNAVWIRALKSFDSHALPGSEDTTGIMFWSPDSRFVAFQSGNKLKKIEIAGPKPPEVICEAPGFALGGSWNRSDVIIFGTYDGILQVPAAGGIPRYVTSVRVSHFNGVHAFPSFMSDGRQFVYLDVGKEPGIYVGSLDAAPEKQNTKRIVETGVMSGYVAPHEGAPGRLLFMREHSLFAQDFDTERLELTGEPVLLASGVSKYLLSAAFSASETGILTYRTGFYSSRLSWFDRHGKELDDLHDSAPQGYVDSLALSPDGTSLAVTRINPTATDLGVAVWITDLPRGVSTRLSFEAVPHGSPAWSTDGRHLAFGITRRSGMAIVEKVVNGSGAERVIVAGSPDEKYPNDWSGSRQVLLYTREESGKNTGLWLADLNGSADQPAAVRPFVDTEFNEAQGKFSPDGRWVAYASDESGRWEVYVRSFADSPEAETRTQISRDGGHEPQWRRDGRELFYITDDGKVMSVKVKSGPAFQAEAPEPLFQVQHVHPKPEGFLGFRWAVSPDGDRFLIAREPPSTEPISIVVNWPAEMKK